MIKVNKMDNVVVNLSQEYDNRATTVEFDFSVWYEKYGAGTISLLHRRRGDTESYPVTLQTTADHVAKWVVSSVDTAKDGRGACQLMYQVGSTIKAHSAVARTVVLGSNYDVGEVPDSYDDWIATLTTLAGTTTTNASAADSSARTASSKAAEAVSNAQASSASATQAENAKSLAVSAKNDAVSAKNDAIVAKNSVEASANQIATNKADITELKNDLTQKITKPTATPTVGKILKVQSVNADGTFTCEWADEPTYELIEEITLTEDVTKIARTTEPNGNAYKFKKLLFLVDSKGYSTTNVYLRPKINNTEIADGMPILTNATNSKGMIIVDCVSGIPIIETCYASFGSTSVSQIYRGMFKAPLISQNITSFNFIMALKSGMNIKIYGVRG